MIWLTDELRKQVRRVFEPKYHRQLTDQEVTTIADNLSGYMEAILQWRWRKSYANKKVGA